jgi:cytidylate kinase
MTFNDSIVTIDGPASSGKTTLGFLLAKKLGYRAVDAGQIYRAGSYYIRSKGIPLDNDSQLASIFKDMPLRFQEGENASLIYIGEENVTPFLDDETITSITTNLGSRYLVREAVKTRQKEYGILGSIVMTGRDIGSEIFPNAHNKFFINATPEVRAYRRFLQLKDKNPEVVYEKVLSAILLRDQSDATRAISPMRIPPDAFFLDSTNLSREKAVNIMYDTIVNKNLLEGNLNTRLKEMY